MAAAPTTVPWIAWASSRSSAQPGCSPRSRRVRVLPPRRPRGSGAVTAYARSMAWVHPSDWSPVRHPPWWVRWSSSAPDRPRWPSLPDGFGPHDGQAQEPEPGDDAVQVGLVDHLAPRDEPRRDLLDGQVGERVALLFREAPVDPELVHLRGH